MNKIIMVTLLLMPTFFFTGCTQYWYQEGKTIEQCRLDRQDCVNELTKFSSFQRLGNYEFDFMEDCMIKKGYRLVTENKLPVKVKREEPETSLHWRLRGIAGTVPQQ